MDDGSSPKNSFKRAKRTEPEKFLHNKALKFGIVNRLLKIRNSYREEMSETFIKPFVYSSAVKEFNLLCSHFDNKELVQLRRAREVNDLLYNEYKNGGYFFIERFVKLYDK